MQTKTISFDQFGLHPLILKTLQKIGFTAPTPIQEHVIPFIIEGRDVIARAKTGSGKTAAFCLPALHLLSEDENKKIIIVTPTRELALQVAEEFSNYGKGQGIQAVAVYGGEPVFTQLKRIKKDTRAIVGTPGRLLDLFRSKNLKGFAPSIIVLDEADEMLNMGFMEDVQAIFTFLPKERQTLLFSATMPAPIREMAQQFLTDPIVANQISKETPHEDIEQVFHLVHYKNRSESLTQLIKFYNPSKSLIFCNTKKQVDELSQELLNLGLSVLRLHGDMAQKERLTVIESFRKSKEACLIATDVAGRGINVADISHVFNFELPFSLESYTHRIGRTGRAGKKGMAITLITQKETNLIRKVLRKDPKKMTLLPIPSMQDIRQRVKTQFIDSLKNEVIQNNAKSLLSSLEKEMSLEDICLKFISRYCQNT
jgi:ATP-dependent RNA helicase DeaD